VRFTPIERAATALAFAFFATSCAGHDVLPTGPGQPASPTPPSGNLSMSVARAGHTATSLPDGRVLIFGGVADDVRPQAEIYDPSKGTFSPADDMITFRGGHPAVVLPGGKLLFVGTQKYFVGSNPIELRDGRTFFAEVPSAETYDPVSGTFTPTGAYAHATVAGGWATRTLLLDGRVLLTGNEASGACCVGATELFDPQSGTFSLTGAMQALSDTPGWGTLLTDGTVLTVQWNFDIPPDDVELYDPTTGAFTLVGHTSANHEYSRAVRLQDGTVLVTGGQLPGGNGTAETRLYLPALRTFAAATPMITGRHQHTATLLSDGTVLITGGFHIWPTPTASAEIYRPQATP
jgi:galactose oxidase-like protein